MTYAMLYAENGDIIGTYTSRDEAVRRLAEFVERHPGVQDDVGLRSYEGGLPAGAYEPAIDVLGDRMPQQHHI